MSNEDDPGSHCRSKQGEDRNVSLRGLPAEVRKGWREFKELVQRIGKLVETAADVALDVYKLAVRLLRFVMGNGGPAAALGAAIGFSSPLTEGWGVNPLGGSQLATWAPVLLLPGMAMALRSIAFPPGTAAKDGDDQQGAPQTGDDRPAMPGHSLPTTSGEPFEDHLFVLETLDESACPIRVQVRVTRRSPAQVGQDVLRRAESVAASPPRRPDSL